MPPARGRGMPRRQPPPRQERPLPIRTPEPATSLYDGEARGGRAVIALNSQNMEFLGFPALSHGMYDALTVKDPRLRRTLP